MASKIKVISATPVTPYVSNPSAVGPTESPALSPVQSAMTPGLRGSSSLTLKTIFIRSRSEEHTSELQSLTNLVCRLLLEKKKKKKNIKINSHKSKHVHCK